MIELVDTHCHIHFADYGLDPEQAVADAVNDGVTRLMCIGCTLPDSKTATQFAKNHKNIWATIGLHPHEGSVYVHDHLALQQFHELASHPKVVAIGETGLDYHYMHSTKVDQEKLLRFQLDIALEHKLPLIFHVRKAFSDFWKIFDEYNSSKQPIKGVVHSFSSSANDLEEILSRNLYVGVNGIATFAKNPDQIEAYKRIPTDKLLLETDAPFLTPVPFRGKICQPKYVRVVAEYLSKLRGEPLKKLATQTTQNALLLFGLE